MSDITAQLSTFIATTILKQPNRSIGDSRIPHFQWLDRFIQSDGSGIVCGRYVWRSN